MFPSHPFFSLALVSMILVCSFSHGQKNVIFQDDFNRADAAVVELENPKHDLRNIDREEALRILRDSDVNLSSAITSVTTDRSISKRSWEEQMGLWRCAVKSWKSASWPTK